MKGDEESERLLESANAQGIKNPIPSTMDGSYRYGDTIYVKQTTERTRREEEGSGGSIDQMQAFLDMTNTGIIESLGVAPLTIPGRGQVVVRENGDIVLVDADYREGDQTAGDVIATRQTDKSYKSKDMDVLRAMLQTASSTFRNRNK